MSQSEHEPSGHATPQRAEQLGERIGYLASLALRRIEATARQAMPGPIAPPAAEAPDRESPAPGAAGASTRAATERAERLLDDMGERIGGLASISGPMIQRFVALAREEAEDIWAEAQHIRHSNSRDSG